MQRFQPFCVAMQSHWRSCYEKIKWFYFYLKTVILCAGKLYRGSHNRSPLHIETHTHTHVSKCFLSLIVSLNCISWATEEDFWIDHYYKWIGGALSIEIKKNQTLCWLEEKALSSIVYMMLCWDHTSSSLQASSGLQGQVWARKINVRRIYYRCQT